jgi:lipase
MILKIRRWGDPAADPVICLHGITQHGGIFERLGRRLAAAGHSVLAVDLRGHGESGREPPWGTESHVEDVIETLAAEGVGAATWVGHSFGGRIALALAAREPTRRLVLLDPGLEVPPERALRSAEIERLDWSFATVDGAVNAMLSSDSIVAAPRETVDAFVRDDLRKGPDGRFRFSFCPSAAVVAWSEVALPAPPAAMAPTLLVRAEAPLYDADEVVARYSRQMGDLLTEVTVPNGHNVLWEAPEETAEAIERFLASPSAGE